MADQPERSGSGTPARAAAKGRYDAVVIGGGPAGLAAATWLLRYRCRVAVVDSGEPRNRWVELVHGYLGQDPVKPADLLQGARKDLSGYGAWELVESRALTVAGSLAEGFRVETEAGEIEAGRLVLATGTRDVFPDVEGFLDHYGADVFHCPLCDGYEARERDTVVLGWDRSVVGFAQKLLRWARSVTIVTDGRRFETDERHREALEEAGIRVLEDDAVRLVGRRGALKGLELRRSMLLPCSLAFFSLPNLPVNELARQLGCRLAENEHVAVDGHGATSVPGVYAAGDLTPGEQLVQVAAAKGAMAGLACAASLAGV